MSTAVRREGASGTGLATTTADGTVLDTWYPAPALGPDAPDTAADLDPLAGPDDARGVTTAVVRTAVASLADPPVDAPDAYLRLHLLSHRLVAPHEVNLDGVFGLLANVVWTNHGPWPCTAWTSSRGWSTTPCRPASASRTPTGCGSARTWPRAPR